MKLITRWEGFSERAYWDYGRWSIGYGTSSSKGQTIDKDDAYELARSHAENTTREITRMCGLRCSVRQTAALTSFAYNLGLSRLRKSTLWRLTLEGNYSQASQEFKKWVRVDGKVSRGLIRRREAERIMYDGR